MKRTVLVEGGWHRGRRLSFSRGGGVGKLTVVTSPPCRSYEFWGKDRDRDGLQVPQRESDGGKLGACVSHGRAAVLNSKRNSSLWVHCFSTPLQHPGSSCEVQRM